MRRNPWRARIALLILCALPLAGYAVSAQVGRARPASLARLAPIERNETMEVIYFDCGKADSMLIRQGGHAMLIDAATRKEGPGIAARLREEGIQKLDALLITHEDKDHIGGAGHVLRALEVERAYTGRITEDSRHLKQFLEALDENGVPATTLVAGDHFALGSALVTVIGPVGDGPRKENDASLVLRVDFGQTAFVFAADAERLSLAEMLDAPGGRQKLCAQVLKVPHHGRANARSAALFEAVRPEIAVITTDWGNESGLPDAAVVAALERVGARVYVTGDGEVRVVSDGFALTTETVPR